ncbi:uncharacterized protein BDZ99DRAFT_86532 [Mytilinidion resinicola]|uniref:Uncharacterized protein n=1 Tax=Mytilinidion resinicola TaxID=574789 RepID=A0A6A6YFQ9_9PEZI|nr:uncharacterized protein BDZ99DRAFT_86532 [Mytilinidion resinicola]KAF2806854.1 hypothetical protein BDZ99DRAFT_86532 [Mytilinidion resinicola]
MASSHSLLEITGNQVQALGKTYHVNHYTSADQGLSMFPTCLLPTTVLQNIQCVELGILVFTQTGYLDDQLWEDLTLYRLRYNIRRVQQLLAAAPHLRSVRVQPHVQTLRTTWDREEIIAAAIFTLKPLKSWRSLRSAVLENVVVHLWDS